MRIQRAQEAALPCQETVAHKVQHLAQRLRSRGATALGDQRRAGRPHGGEVKLHVAAAEPGLQPQTQRLGPTVGRIGYLELDGRLPILALDAGQLLHVGALHRVAHAAAAHGDDQRFHKGVDAVHRHVRAVVDGDVAAPGRGAGHGQQPHGRHGLHVEDALAHPVIVGVGQPLVGELAQEGDGAVHRFEPGLTPHVQVVEAGVLVEVLELLQLGREVFVRRAKGRPHHIGNGSVRTQAGALGAIQNVMFGRFVLTRSQQDHLHNVLHLFHRGHLVLGRHDVDRALGQFGQRRLRFLLETIETTQERVLDEAGVEGNDAPVALDDGFGHGDFDCPVAMAVGVAIVTGAVHPRMGICLMDAGAHFCLLCRTVKKNSGRVEPCGTVAMLRRCTMPFNTCAACCRVTKSGSTGTRTETQQRADATFGCLLTNAVGLRYLR